ncbi:division/cell wall cluster transcriptional repressor MraZ [Echinimonas agarilytica]|uniref:Transcriptional regulator MraZ n=1 Tax=Echinimonas agarilytica TaxID=1215918 RepID=A0AA41W4S3_9GAMM|nr:division/cell wall cluster transcriptional repressor MraZ [Echinimonas agarilytica]MCM2678770.1 division/cell wall cluster transcriptional repressor MraZ [Echinimonas agarilytica]
MFRGANSISLDSKGRLAIPSRYREVLMNQCGGRLVCTIDVNSACLLLYPLPEWEAIELKLRQLSTMRPAERRLQRLLIGHATDCDMDKNGRLLLPATLRKHAALEKQMMLVGQSNKFEIWSEENWQAQVEEDMAAQLADDEPLSDKLLDISL